MTAKKKKCILLVEDETVILKLESKTLKELGYNVITALTGQKALECVAENDSIDLVLMDIDLGPGTDGIETAGLILENKNLPVVFLTNNSDKDIFERVNGITHYGFILKNSGNFVLHSSIEMALQLFDAHQKISESEKKFRCYFENSTNGVLVTNSDGKYIEVNETACRLTGFSKDELLSKSIFDLVTPDYRDDVLKHYNTLRAKGKAMGTLLYRKKDGSVSCWITNAVKVSDDQYLCLLTDITEQKNIELDLVTAKKNYKEESYILNKIIELNPYPIQILDVNGYTIKTNEAHKTLFGAVPPDDYCMFNDPILIKENLAGQFDRIKKGNVVHFPIFYYNVHDVYNDLPDKPVWLKMTGFPVFNSNGFVEKIILMHEDVTEREFALKSLKESERRFRSAISVAPIGIASVNLDGNVNYINEKFVQIFGYNLNDCNCLDEWWPLGYPDKEYRDKVSEEWLGAMQKILNGEISFFTNEYYVKNKEGNYLNVEMSMTLNGDTWLVIFNDLTGRIKAEEAVRERDLLFKTIFETVSDAILITGYPDGTVVECNDKLGGYVKAELVGKSTIEMGLWGDETERDKIIAQVIEKGEIKDFETTFIRKNGNAFIGSISINYFEVNGKKYFVSVVRDISERKKAEEALQFERTMIEAVFNSVPGLIYLYDDQSRLIKWNRKHSDLTGYSDEELYGMGVYDWYKGDDVSLKIISEGLGDTLLTGFGQAEAELQRKDGSKIPMYLTAVPLKINDKVYFTGIGIDITARKTVEEKLKKSENRLRTITENIPDTILQINSEGKIIYVNRLVKGLSEELVYGSSVYKWVPEDQHSVVKMALDEAFIKGKTFEYESDGPGPDGTWRKYFIRLMPVIIDDKIDSAIYLTTDITERKIAEDTIKNLLHEKELLLKEVHHRIKNNMGTIINLLNLQAETSDEEKVADALNETKNRILSMQVLYDKLYRSDKVTNLFLSEYLIPLADEIIKNFPNAKNVKIEKNITDVLLDPKILSALGIIVNELITNSMKYAFPGFKEGTINISSKLDGNELTLVISDSGIGLPENISIETSSGFGLRLVRLLTMQLRGKVAVERDNGAKFTLKFKI